MVGQTVAQKHWIAEGIACRNSKRTRRCTHSETDLLRRSYRRLRARRHYPVRPARKPWTKGHRPRALARALQAPTSRPLRRRNHANCLPSTRHRRENRNGVACSRVLRNRDPRRRNARSRHRTLLRRLRVAIQSYLFYQPELRGRPRQPGARSWASRFSWAQPSLGVPNNAPMQGRTDGTMRATTSQERRARDRRGLLSWSGADGGQQLRPSGHRRPPKVDLGFPQIDNLGDRLHPQPIPDRDIPQMSREPLPSLTRSGRP